MLSSSEVHNDMFHFIEQIPQFINSLSTPGQKRSFKKKFTNEEYT